MASATFCRGFGGGYTEFICLPAGEPVLVLPDVDPAEAVCLAVYHLTAHMAMHPTAGVPSCERILVDGAAGGAATGLLQLGNLAGLEMDSTASKHNHELVSALGAAPIDYCNRDFVDRIRTLTADGVDVVFDPVGGARQLWRSYRVLRNGGPLVWFGVAARIARAEAAREHELLERGGYAGKVVLVTGT